MRTTPDASAPDAEVHLEIARLELRSLYVFASLLTGDQIVAAGLARGVAASNAHEVLDHRPAAAMRARIARRARRVAPPPDHPALVLRALGACSPRERAVLVCMIHERLSVAETAFIAGCDPIEVDGLLARATAAAGELLAPRSASPAGVPGVLRMAMLELADELRSVPEVSRRMSPLAGKIVLAAGVAAVAGLITGAVIVSRPAAPPKGSEIPTAFEHPRFGYGLTIGEGWRSVPAVAKTEPGGVDPTRLGLASLDPTDEPAVFIPRRARAHPAMLRISVVRSTIYDDDVAAFRDGVAASAADRGVVITAAIDRIANRPATRFRFEHPSNDASCPSCRAMTWITHWVHGTTMTIELRTFGADEQLLDQGWDMVRSLRRSEASLRYDAMHGSVPPALGGGEHLDVLLQFLDARVAGVGAESWRGDAGPSDQDLYGVVGYRVRVGEQAGDGWSYVVTVERQDRLGRQRGERHERILVGPGQRKGVPWPMVVRAIEVIG